MPPQQRLAPLTLALWAVGTAARPNVGIVWGDWDGYSADDAAYISNIAGLIQGMGFDLSFFYFPQSRPPEDDITGFLQEALSVFVPGRLPSRGWTIPNWLWRLAGEKGPPLVVDFSEGVRLFDGWPQAEVSPVDHSELSQDVCSGKQWWRFCDGPAALPASMGISGRYFRSLYTSGAVATWTGSAVYFLGYSWNRNRTDIDAGWREVLFRSLARQAFGTRTSSTTTVTTGTSTTTTNNGVAWLRLAAGDAPRQGPLEVNVGGQWGAVCFQQQSLGELSALAQAACRRLGFSGGLPTLGQAVEAGPGYSFQWVGSLASTPLSGSSASWAAISPGQACNPVNVTCGLRLRAPPTTTTTSTTAHSRAPGTTRQQRLTTTSGRTSKAPPITTLARPPKPSKTTLAHSRAR